ncbi:hypothetical protein [Leptothoe kymatousa]|uniref:Uncharacterized protein n=1 Tax=Leptothoe kymatousa TAU-MAC 1615 TaxID=2364775 RepID=A0ABS5Y535_9CYAN|nr:hypothetical protein [Leptothoe kymatousa]MBT9312926.1 hypothetical protein [Leptothoe kymatousa TAU-MAC 1615]
MTYCETSPLLNAAQLKIQGREINEAMGWSRGWLANLRFLALCLADPQLRGLSHLLAQVDEHNSLVSAIEMDIRKAASKEKTLLNDLHAVVKTFYQTKEEIIQAIAQYGERNDERNNTSNTVVPDDVLSYEPEESGGVYNWLIRKSRALRTKVQGLVDSTI